MILTMKPAPLAVLLSAMICVGARAQATVTKLAESHSGLDMDGDGVRELGTVKVLSQHEEGKPLLILLEARLSQSKPLRERLNRYVDDLANDGYAASVISVELPTGGKHRDGLRLLGIRRLLQAYRKAQPTLSGAVLVGHFPDAYLVRTVNWRKKTKLKLGKQSWKKVSYLRRRAEDVARRCDLVLADLDGPWESLYVQPSTTFPTVTAVWPEGVPENGGACEHIETGSVAFADFFHVDDGRVKVTKNAVSIDDDKRDFECTASDRERGNPLALPEINISRIDARGAAWSPKQTLGSRPLFDAKGKPIAAKLEAGEKVHWLRDLWQPDPKLELRLLSEFFDRNHRYRTTARGEAFKPASIAWGLGSGFGQMKRAAAEWADFKEAGYNLRKGADLRALTEWYKRPAVLRTIRAHSDSRTSVFKKASLESLHEVLGGDPLCWSVEGNQLVPSLSAPTRGERAGFFLWRTLWENGSLPDYPYLMVHMGCHAMSPTASNRAFDTPEYGALQNADSLLFLTPALAIVGRAKVFYDEPRGFVESLAKGESFGAAWARYYDIESQAKSWSKVGGDIGRKRSYFWSVIGDWTLRLQR